MVLVFCTDTSSKVQISFKASCALLNLMGTSAYVRLQGIWSGTFDKGL